MGVLKSDIDDAILNTLYRNLPAVIARWRVSDPDRLGKAMSGVGHAQKTLLDGERFDSMEEAQSYLDNWGRVGRH